MQKSLHQHISHCLLPSSVQQLINNWETEREQTCLQPKTQTSRLASRLLIKTHVHTASRWGRGRTHSALSLLWKPWAAESSGEITTSPRARRTVVDGFSIQKKNTVKYNQKSTDKSIVNTNGWDKYISVVSSMAWTHKKCCCCVVVVVK